MKHLLPLFFLACSQPHGEIRYASKEVAACPTLTQSLIDYTHQQIRDFFGQDASADITIQDQAVLHSLGYASAWKLHEIILSCGSTQELCNLSLHELARQIAYDRFGYKEAVDAENVFVTWYKTYYTWPCLPAVLAENGVE